MRRTVRSLARDRAFSILAVSTLAIGIGVGTAAFNHLASFLWSDPKLFEPDRLVSFTYRSEGEGAVAAEGPIPYGDLLEYHREGLDAGEVVAMTIFGAPVSIDDRRSAWAWGHLVSERYFEVLGVQMALGRSLSTEDHRSGSSRSVVLSDRFWRRHFERSPDVLGRGLTIGGELYTVVGVTPRGFIGTGIPADLYTPLAHARDVAPDFPFEDRSRATVFAVARLAPGITLEAAESRFTALAKALDREWPPNPSAGPRRPYLVGSGLSSRSIASADIQSGSWFRRSVALMGAALLFHLLATMNAANLFVARCLSRRRDLVIRSSLGASRGRLIAGLFGESLLVSGVAAAIGVVLSRLLVALIRRYVLEANPLEMGHWNDGAEILGFDWRIASFAAGASIATALLAGLLPILRATRAGAATAVNERAMPRLSARGRRALVMVQVALSALLLSASLPLVRSLASTWSMDSGFDKRNLVVASFALDVSGLDEVAKRAAYRQVEEAAAAIPGVESASLASFVPLGASRSVAVRDPGTARSVDAEYVLVRPSYFKTLRLPLLAGRPLEHEGMDDARAVVVSKTLAEALWPASDPLDRSVHLRFATQGDAEYRVVGVAGDILHAHPAAKPRPAIYVSFDQVFRSQMSLVARSTIAPAALLPAFRQSLEGAHPRIALIATATFDDHLARNLADRRLDTSMSSILATLALLVAASGIGSLLAYLVRSRRRELAVRLAIGAEPRHLLRRVLGEAAVMVAAGAVIGLAASVALTRLLRAVLVSVERVDLMSVSTGALTIGLVGLVAALGPAVAAARVAPSEVLRDE